MPDAQKDNLLLHPGIEQVQAEQLDHTLTQKIPSEIAGSLNQATNEQVHTVQSVMSPSVEDVLHMNEVDHQAEDRNDFVDKNTPESYKKPTLSLVGKLFGHAAQKTADHMFDLDSNRYTNASNFNDMKQKKEQERQASLDPVKEAA